MGHGPDDKVPGAEEEDDEQHELQPDDPLDARQVDHRQEDDDQRRDRPLGQRRVRLGNQPRDRLAEARGAERISYRLTNE